LSPFGSTPFRWLWASSLASSAAGGMERTATAWLALEAGGGALAVGIVLAARMLPSLLFGLAAGTIADRVDRTRQLAMVGIAGVPLMAVLSWLAASSSVQFWQVALISFAAGCVNVFDAPARQTLVMDSVRPEVAPNAIALNALATRISIAVGAFGAGLLIPHSGVASCYAIVALALALSAILVVRVRTVSARHVDRNLPPFWSALRDAARLVVDVPAVRTLIAASIACEVLAFSHPTALPVVARDVLDSGAEGLGTLNAAGAVGGTVAVVLLSLLPGRVRREPVMGLVFALYGASLLGLAASRSLLLAAAIMVVIGACAAAFDVLQQTLIQLAVPHEQRGRAVGVWVLGIGSAPLGHLELGVLVSQLGAPSGLFLNGSLVLAAAATLLVRAPEYRGGARAKGS
jgi:predicted MFS family arabinose efflux permease